MSSSSTPSSTHGQQPASPVRLNTEINGRLKTGRKISNMENFSQCWWATNKGLLFIVLAEMFSALMAATARLLETGRSNGEGLHTFQILFARMGITALLSSLYMWYAQTPQFPFGSKEVRWLLVSRSVAGFLGVYGLYYSLEYLPLSEATVITFLAPILTAAVGSVLFKEKFGRLEVIAGIISFVGVFLIARPASLLSVFSNARSDADSSSFSNESGSTAGSASSSQGPTVAAAQRLSAVGVALLGICGAVGAYTSIRCIGDRAHPLISVNYYATMCTVVSMIALAFIPGIDFKLPADRREWMFLSLIGTSGFLLQYLLTAGLTYDKSSRATYMMYSSILFALLLDKVIWGVVPDWTSIAGGALIISSIIVVALRNSKPTVRVQSHDEEDGSMEVLYRDGATGDYNRQKESNEVEIQDMGAGRPIGDPACQTKAGKESRATAPGAGSSTFSQSLS